MDNQTFDRLVAIMARMASGDRAALITLYEQFGGHVAAMLRRHVRRLGVNHIDPDDLDGLVIDACFALEDCAPAWDPAGGALPWNWAARRLATLASAWVGQHADSYDPERHPAAPAEHVEFVDTPADVDELEVLGRLAACHDGCALFFEALQRVASPRDQTLLLELRAQADAGDPSPAVTVGRRHGLSPDAVRQAACRLRSRLRRLAADDARYASLAELPVLA